MPQGSLAAAGLFDVLEHIEDDERFVATLRTLLQRRGRLYLTVPAFSSLWSSEDDLVGHHRRYTTRRLSALLMRHGFAVDYATFAFSPLPLPLFVLRTLPSRLRRRTTLDADQTAAELKPSPTIAGLVTRLLRYEVTCVRKAWLIPVGTSCLVAAHLA